MGIVVFGAVFVDIKGYPLKNFLPKGRNAGKVEQVHGGVSRNVVEDIGNVELNPVYVSVVDDTGSGADVIRKLKEHHVDTRYIRQVPDGMGTWLAIFDDKGDVYASISKRPDLSVIGDILDEQGDEIISNCDSIALEIDMEKELVTRILKLAQKHNKKVYAVVSNMSIAVKRRDLLKHVDCMVCNLEEAGLFFSEDFDDIPTAEMVGVLADKISTAGISRMVVTMGSEGAVYVEKDGEKGLCPSMKVIVKDVAGCGDAFFAGVTIGLTYGKSLAEACEIGTRLAASTIVTSENVCPRFQPSEFGIEL
ncbi:MAG: carbohydrate kinase family protein [Erysipelotrichaceae bacterium]|nr:carbohydrate kinase family protein [Erysipelotrichaceae bacterium]